MNVHEKSPLGRARAAAAALEARHDQMRRLVEQREAELARADQDLQAVPIDVKDLRVVTKILERQDALAHLLSLAKDEAQRYGQELDKVVERLSTLQGRLNRLEASMNALQDQARALPYSPVERAEKLLIDRYRQAVLAGDPDELPQFQEEVNTGVDKTRWLTLRPELASYVRDVAKLCEVSEWYSVRVREDNALHNVTVDGRPFTRHPTYLRGDELTGGIRRAPALIVESVEGPQD